MPPTIPPASDTVNNLLAEHAARLQSKLEYYKDKPDSPPDFLFEGYLQYLTLTSSGNTNTTSTGSTNGTGATETDIIAVTSITINYVKSETIDLRDFKHISIFPDVVTAGGLAGYYKIQWSFDTIDWFDETIDVPGSVTNGEQIVAQNIMVRSFQASLGAKPLSATTFSKRARYVAIAQRSDSSVSLSVEYSYQKF